MAPSQYLEKLRGESTKRKQININRKSAAPFTKAKVWSLRKCLGRRCTFRSLSLFLFLFVMGGGHPPSEGHFSTAAPNESSQGERAAEQESKHKLIYISLCVRWLFSKLRRSAGRKNRPINQQPL
jgi:hypothetical protein